MTTTCLCGSFATTETAIGPMCDRCVTGYEMHVTSAGEGCACCPNCNQHPCASCLAGGVCDAFRCECDDAYDDLYGDDPNADGEDDDA